LANPVTLAAVFNATLSTNIDGQATFFDAVDAENSPKFRCHYVDTLSDLEIENASFGGAGDGTLITFNTAFCERIQSTAPTYFRLRLRLDKNALKEFVDESTPEDRDFLSSFIRTELIEFRLNERRNYPPEIATRAQSPSAQNFVLKEVNYFLIRDVRFDYVLSHVNLRKMRRLEGPQWADYLDNFLSSKEADKMLIYQWKKEEKEGQIIEDFIALAKFKVPSANIELFLLVIIALGATGSATAAVIASSFVKLNITSESHANFATFLVFVAAISIWYFWRKLFRQQ
jgi:hypothetical protein